MFAFERLLVYQKATTSPTRFASRQRSFRADTVFS